jgi:hypothetical protein
LAIAALVTAIAAGLTFRRAITPWSSLPDSDYWGNISGLITESGVRLTLANLFRHNNEHIVVIPKLIYAANYLATSGSNTGLIVYSLAVGIACTGPLLVLARELLLDTPWRLVLCALLFPLVMFSAKLTHSYFLGMSGTIWLTADLFVIVSAAALARAVDSKSANWLLVSLVAGVLGVLAYSTAIYMLIVLVIFCLAKLLRPNLPGPGSRPLILGTAAAALLVLGLGLAFRNAPKAKPDLAFDLIGLVEFVLIYLGNALSTGPLRIVAGLLILAAGAASIWRLAAERRIEETLLWVILFFFAPFNALMTGIGRLGYGVKIAATSRYQSVTAITLIATVVLVLAALPKGAVSRRAARMRAIAFGALLACAALIAIDRSYVANYTARNERKVVAEIALRQGIEGNQHLKAATPAFPQLKRSLPMLRAARHAPFHWRSRCEERLGQQIAERTGPSAGRIETLSACPAATAARSSCPAGLSGMGWQQSASSWPTPPARRLAREPSSRAVPTWNRPRRGRSASSAGKASRQCRHHRRCARSRFFRVKASLCRSPVAKPPRQALRRPSAGPTGTCRSVAGHQYIAFLQPFSALS